MKDHFSKHKERWCSARIKGEEGLFTWHGKLVDVSGDHITFESKDGSMRTFLASDITELKSREYVS